MYVLRASDLPLIRFEFASDFHRSTQTGRSTHHIRRSPATHPVVTRPKPHRDEKISKTAPVDQIPPKYFVTGF